jgi:hypothetical protein
MVTTMEERSPMTDLIAQAADMVLPADKQDDPLALVLAGDLISVLTGRINDALERIEPALAGDVDPVEFTALVESLLRTAELLPQLLGRMAGVAGAIQHDWRLEDDRPAVAPGAAAAQAGNAKTNLGDAAGTAGLLAVALVMARTNLAHLRLIGSDDLGESPSLLSTPDWIPSPGHDYDPDRT